MKNKTKYLIVGGVASLIILIIGLTYIFFNKDAVLKVSKEEKVKKEVEDYVAEDYDEVNDLDGINDAGMSVSNKVVDSAIRDENIGTQAQDIDGIYMTGPNIDDVFTDPDHEDYENIVEDNGIMGEIEQMKDEYRKEVSMDTVIEEDVVDNPEDFMKTFLFEDLAIKNNKTYPNYKIVSKDGEEKYLKEKSGYKLIMHSMSSCSYCLKTMVTIEDYLASGFNQLDKEDIVVLYHGSSDIDQYNYYNYDFLYKLSNDSGVTNADFIGAGVPRWYLLDSDNKVVVNGIGTIVKTQLTSIDNIVALDK